MALNHISSFSSHLICLKQQHRNLAGIETTEDETAANPVSWGAQMISHIESMIHVYIDRHKNDARKAQLQVTTSKQINLKQSLDDLNTSNKKENQHEFRI